MVHDRSWAGAGGPRGWGLSLALGLALGLAARPSAALGSPSEAESGPSEPEPGAADQPENQGAAPPDADPEVENIESIESIELADLLELELDDQLGTTEAVSRTDESVLRAPATLTTLDARRIRLSGATTFPDLLRGIPGMQVVRNSAGNYLVSARGAGGVTGNNVVVLLDGVPLNSPVDSAVDWDMIPIAVEDVERVEVVRGPVSASYGADAYTSVINIVTRQTTLSRHSAAIHGAGGVDLQPAPVGRGGANYIYSGERVTFKWFATGRYDDAVNVAETATGERQHPPAIHVGSLAALDIQTGEHSTFHTEFGGGWARRGSLEQLVLESQPIERGMVISSLGWNVRELPSILDTVDIWARSRATFIDTEAAAFQGFSYADTSASRSELGVDLGFDFHEMVRGRLGAQGTLDYLEAPYLHPAVSGTPRVGAAVHTGVSVFPIESLDLRYNLRVDIPPTTGKPALSSRASLVYHAARWALRATFATAFRAPSYVEAGGQFRDPATGFILLEGDPDIRPPRSRSIELGATIAPITGLTLRPTIYAAALTQAMIADFEPLVHKTYANDPTPRWLLGAELELDWDIIDELSLSAGGGYLRFLAYDETLTPLVGVPEQNSTWTASLRLFGSTINERFGYGLGGIIGSPRRYLARVGIPPVIIDESVPYTGYVDAHFEFQPGLKLPLWLSLNGQSGLLPGVSESPFPGAAQLGTVIMLGLEWRRE